MMLKEAATLDEVKEISRRLILDAVRHQPELAKGHRRPEGSEVWTKAIWNSFNLLRTDLGEGWNLYPKEQGKGSGRADGEFLVDFILIDDRLGPRIACELELGTKKANSYDWAFSKLAGVKADIKIFAIEHSLETDGSLPPGIKKIILSYLSNNIHLDPREHYVVMQCDGADWRCFHWNPPSNGPLKEADIDFLSLMSFNAETLTD